MRYFAPILVLLALLAGLATLKFKQISSLIRFGQQAAKAGPPPEVVGTATAQQAEWAGALSAVGSVTAARGVAVSNEAAGVVTGVHFESGDSVRAGQVLVTLDTSVERAQLASLEARRELATVTAGRSRLLVNQQAAPRAQLDNDEAQLKSQRADLSALRAQIDRKTVRAPFAGRLGIRTVNLGQYLNPGTPVTVLQAMGTVYVDFSLPQQHLGDARVGSKVRITLAGDDPAPIEGVIAAIDPAIDSTTRTVKLRASALNQKERLRPGMFVNVDLLLPTRAAVVTAPATAVVHAAYGDSVFVVEDRKVRQQFVRLGEARGDLVALLAGVKAGQELVTQGAFKLRNGGSVVINNDIQAQPSINPRPENR